MWSAVDAVEVHSMEERAELSGKAINLLRYGNSLFSLLFGWAQP